MDEDKPLYAQKIRILASSARYLQLSKSASHWEYNGQLVPDSSKLHIIPRMNEKISVSRSHKSDLHTNRNCPQVGAEIRPDLRLSFWDNLREIELSKSGQTAQYKSSEIISVYSI